MAFRSRERSVHHAIRTVKLTAHRLRWKPGEPAGWIEGDLSSYFDTVHHRLLMKAVRRRISDARFYDSAVENQSRRDDIDVGLFRVGQ